MTTKHIVVTGSGTGAGKTVVSAILVAALNGEYWKPVECGESDTATIQKWLPKHRIHPPGYFFEAPLSPHHASSLEHRSIELQKLIPPRTENPLIMETAGGVLVPFTHKQLSFEYFSKLDALWIVVTNLYLGCINHTLLTLEFLKGRGIPFYLVFTGRPHSESESAILNFSSATLLGRVAEEKKISSQIILKYARRWQQKIRII